MEFVFSLLSSYPFIELPYDWIGWVGFVLFFTTLLLVGIKFYNKYEVKSYWRWVTLLLFCILALITTLFMGLKVSEGFLQRLEWLPFHFHLPAIMLLSAIPAVLTAGILGPVSAAVVAGLSGFFIGIWDTHSVFTIFEFCLLGLVYGLAIRQRFRTPFFSFLRHPLGAGLIIPLAFSPIFVISSFFSSSGSLAIRLDYALTQTWSVVIIRWIEWAFASVLAETFYLLRIKFWGSDKSLQPSPSESSLSFRLIFSMLPLMALAFTAFLAGVWVIAGQASRRMIQDRLAGISNQIIDSLPYFIDTGQSLLTSLDSNGLDLQDSENSYKLIEDYMVPFQYFSQVLLFDQNGGFVTGYPDRTGFYQVSAEERIGIQLALSNALSRTLFLPQRPATNSALVCFITPVTGENGQITGVLLALTDIQVNPFSQPAIQAINSMDELGGEGMILDEKHRAVVHSKPEKTMQVLFTDISSSGQVFFEQNIPGELRQFVYYQPMPELNWGVLLTIPAVQVQQLAFDIAVPLMLMLLMLFIAGLVLWQFVMRRIAGSLRSLADETSLIAEGHLAHSLNIMDHDEIGKFAVAFEQMRISLKARMEELDSLLKVSQGVASHLDAEKAITPILQACVSPGVISARAVICLPGFGSVVSNELEAFGTGPLTQQLAYMDRALFDLMAKQEQFIAPSTSRLRQLRREGYQHLPGALIAIALRHESDYHGLLWIAYESPHPFSDEEIQFINALSYQATLAAVNASLYASAEIGRERLEAVLSSTPEPVLVMDEKLRLILLNSAARQISGLIKTEQPGAAIGEVMEYKGLLDLIQRPMQNRVVTRELILPNGRTYSASVAEVIVREKPVGRICLLQDITHYKKIDTLKTDFVSTVSHDLKTPLTLIRGYTSMLDLVGELNNQQKAYVHKMISSVDNMMILVSNILDLGKIETGIGLSIVRTPVYEVIQKAVVSLEPHALQKRIQLIVDDSLGHDFVIEADPELLQQAFYNLIENAIKYSYMEGKVEIFAHPQTESIIFEVKDTGIGIAPLDLAHVFDKFYRSEQREAYKQRGTGLGLAIVKSIAERHGGKAWVESQLGRGSRFFIEIPVIQNT